MNKPLQKKERPKLNVGFGIGLGEYTTSALIGLASAVLTAGKTIRDKFWEDVKYSTDIGPKMIEQAANLTEMPHGDLTDRNVFKVFAKENRAQKKFNANLIDDLILKRRGVRKSMIEGTFDRAELMSARSVKSILLNATIGAAVGSAVTLGFFNGVATRAKINAIDNAVEPEEKQPSEMKAKLYKDRDALDTATPTEKTAKAIKPSKEIIDGTDKPTSHVDKLVAESADSKDVQVATR